MKAAERGFLIGLSIVLVGACIFVAWTVNGDEAGSGAGGSIDDRRLPPVKPLRDFTTAGGVEVLVLSEGRGETRQKGEAMDIAFTGYIAESGARFQKNVHLGWVLEDGGVIEGWIQGLAGMKRLERRRLRVPSALAYGSMRRGKIMPNTDLVFDIQWAVLDIEDLVEGSGAVAAPGDSVTVFYRGTLDNGKAFDSNQGGEPISFRLRKGGLIDGWVLGVPGMHVGGKRRLWVPWHLAYKTRPRPPSGKPGMVGIPPHANLIFEIELVGVN
jgi:peptidylprolyl isomerase